MGEETSEADDRPTAGAGGWVVVEIGEDGRPDVWTGLLDTAETADEIAAGATDAAATLGRPERYVVGTVVIASASA